MHLLSLRLPAPPDPSPLPNLVPCVQTDPKSYTGIAQGFRKIAGEQVGPGPYALLTRAPPDAGARRQQRSLSARTAAVRPRAISGTSQRVSVGLQGVPAIKAPDMPGL